MGDAVTCVNTSAPGCLPCDILLWLSINPPAPKFLFCDLSNDIGFRWMLDTEEWLKKNNVLLERTKLEALSQCIIEQTPINDVTKCDAELERELILPFLETKVDEPIPPINGFAAENIFLTRFPDFKSNDGLVHHPKLVKLIICDEYPSYSYGDLSAS